MCHHFQLKTASPIIVHCSAGIGRTGSIVGLEIALVKFCAGEKVVLKDIVKEIRNQRHGSVQTDAQYLFMHRVLLALAENRKVFFDIKSNLNKSRTSFRLLVQK